MCFKDNRYPITISIPYCLTMRIASERNPVRSCPPFRCILRRMASLIDMIIKEDLFFGNRKVKIFIKLVA